MSCVPIALLSACGGGGGTPNPGGSGSVTSYQVSATAGAGGTISPASATVNAGGTTTLMVTANIGYIVNGVTGCGGTLSGNTYTTGTINAACTVTASFAADFTWVGGSNSPGASGVYGTLGVAAATNVPRARDGGVTWTDSSGNLWLFGGFAGYVQNLTDGDFLNDLWKYSPSSGEWTWVGGSNTFDATGVYGTQGVAAATNVLGARAAPFRWKDASGNVWLFGGYQYDDPTNTRFEMNDLWTYPATQ